MRTDELIRALSADQLAPSASIDRSIAMALLAGSVLAAAFLILTIGIRADVVQSLDDWRFILKFIVTLGLALPAGALLLRLARPLESGRMPWWLLWFAPIALAAGVASEMMTIPATVWPRRLLGSNALHCLTLIPLLSIAPLLWVFAALKRGAPANPGRAGVVAGLACAGIAAFLYALNCPDDSPLFVATWYVIAIGAVSMIAGAVGSRVLRW